MSIPEYAKTTSVVIGTNTIELKANSAYKPGAYYLGEIEIGGHECVVEALCLQSTCGGRGWIAWDEALQARYETLSAGMRKPLATDLDVTPLGQPQVLGEYLIVIHPAED